MFAQLPESFALSLFDNIDDLTDYCLADNDRKAAILENLLEKIAQEGKSVSGMVCNIPPR